MATPGRYKSVELTILGAGDTDIELVYLGRVTFLGVSVASTVRFVSPDNDPIPLPVIAAGDLPMKFDVRTNFIRITTTVATVVKLIATEN